MKNYITVAALLAAGTAFANAESIVDGYTAENVWTVDFGTAYSDGYQITGEMEKVLFR